MSDRQREQMKEKKHVLRRKWLKVLAFFERRRVGLLRGWDKISGAVARHPVSPLLYVTVLALVVGVFSFNKMYAHAYVLSVDGVEVGVLSADENLDAIVANVESRAASILGEEYSYDGEIVVTDALAADGDFTDAAQVEDAVFDSVGALTEAYAVSVNGVEMGYAPSLEELDALLSRIAAPYLTENTASHDFVEDVETYLVELPANMDYMIEDLYDALTASRVEEADYTVQAGDTFNKIAYANGLTPAEMAALNPDVDINKLYVGQTLIIQQAIPFLSVRTYANETYESVIDSPVEYIETATLYVGNTSLKEKGEDGLALVNADVTYVNGVEVERTELFSQVMKEPTTTYMYTGTTPRPKTASNGYYIWPVRGTITSGYGYRYLFGSYDFHQGVDIACPYGTTIKAADGGVVTTAGWSGSYGKLVVITHDNGTKTYYGHNSSLLVSVGERVYQGQAIAKAGMTGTATGYHCHFEVRVNNRHVNPFNYLP